MEKKYYEIALQFESLDIKSAIEQQLANDTHKDIIFDENSDELYSEDPLTLMLVVGLVSGAVIKESVGWFFEILKKKLKGYSQKKQITNDSISVNVTILNEKYQVNYYIKDDSQEVKKV
ncbi:hypothetical protein [uncultured Kordia sp.]|uniref:hypothetical protein n=1 Tax=uncultured Kordia sp. TaxID=507699 RepID=UPI00261D9ABA|nr:hypothetical protein [uncultured Kordia sp.]